MKETRKNNAMHGRRSFMGRLALLSAGLASAALAGIPILKNITRAGGRDVASSPAPRDARVKVRTNPLAVPRTSTRSQHHG